MGAPLPVTHGIGLRRAALSAAAERRLDSLARARLPIRVHLFLSGLPHHFARLGMGARDAGPLFRTGAGRARSPIVRRHGAGRGKAQIMTRTLHRERWTAAKLYCRTWRSN